MFEINSSSVMPTLPTATPKQRTFFNWNLIVDLTSVIFEARSSLWEMGVGNLPAAGMSAATRFAFVDRGTFGKTRAQETRNLLD